MNSTHWLNLDTLKINIIVAIVVGILLLVKRTILCQLSPLHIFPSLSSFWLKLGEPFVLCKLNTSCKLQLKGDALLCIVSSVNLRSYCFVTLTAHRYKTTLPRFLKILFDASARPQGYLKFLGTCSCHIWESLTVTPWEPRGPLPILKSSLTMKFQLPSIVEGVGRIFYSLLWLWSFNFLAEMLCGSWKMKNIL